MHRSYNSKISLMAEVGLSTNNMSGDGQVQKETEPSRRLLDSLESSMIGLFGKKNVQPLLEPGQLKQMHEDVRKILDSKLGPFLYEFYQTKILPIGMSRLRSSLISDGQETFLRTLVDCWNFYFKEVVPTLDAILYRVTSKGNLSIRQTSLVCFRDELLLKTTDFEEHVMRALRPVDSKEKEGEEAAPQEKVPSEVQHMTLILLTVIDCWPPNKNRLRLERVAASLVSPFLGYHGLYHDFDATRPWHLSDEPKIHATRKLSAETGTRRLSRPLSVQPKQIETLREMFQKTLRKKPQQHFYLDD